jgi:hypothetical protein
MDIFSQIEGLSGENLGSSLLSYLILNSHEIRDSIISLLSEKSPVGPIKHASHFACRTEYPTSSESGNGRIDILIQLDDTVIGIENKFFATFQGEQPEKYIETIQTVSKHLGEINYSEVKYVIFVICPDFRKMEAKNQVRHLEQVEVVTWEEVLKRLECVEEISNPVAKIIRNEFVGYLKNNFSFIRDFERNAPHLRKKFPDKGTVFQGQIAAKLSSMLPGSGRRLSNGKTWIGYYFYDNSEVDAKGWVGFVPRSMFKSETENEAELIISSTYKPDKLDDSFKEVTLYNDNFLPPYENTHAWIIKFDENWIRLEVWRDKLSPFWDKVPSG